MFLRYFPVQETTYWIGNHVYYWVWLRPDRLMRSTQQQKHRDASMDPTDVTRHLNVRAFKKN